MRVLQWCSFKFNGKLAEKEEEQKKKKKQTRKLWTKVERTGKRVFRAFPTFVIVLGLGYRSRVYRG